jgi:hypothetical protein
MIAAAHKAGRLGRALEKDPHHCDHTVRRWQELAGESAILAETGLSFAESERIRSAEASR